MSNKDDRLRIMKKNINIYIDLTGIIKSRINTGIQRVLKEFLQRTLDIKIYEKIKFHYVGYDIKDHKYNYYLESEISFFLKDIQGHELIVNKKIELINESDEISIFFDMDSVWNIHPKRIHLYPGLKKNNFYIFNYLYDLSPVILPQYSHENTCRNFISFLSAVYAQSDMVFFDSVSAEQDFLSIKKQMLLTKEIPTRVTGLGSDFSEKNESISEAKNTLLQKKYILFVGTIEPRKDQEKVLDAFDTLAKKYPDLNLILIGKQGWKVERFIKKITSHKLKDKRFFYLNDISDDELVQFYKNAWIVIYLSKHEGYGLPIAESLRHGNITIASKNSSMYEVGRNFTDYVVYNSESEIVDNISFYYDNPNFYKEKKTLIENKFIPDTWDRVSLTILEVFNGMSEAIKIKQLDKLKNYQFVIISIDIAGLQKSIIEIDKYINFVEEYIIVTPLESVEIAKKLKSNNKISVIDENSILKSHAKDFSKRDHVQKNWLLRCSLLNIKNLQDDFIMLDDDSRPIKKIDRKYFISEEGRYNAYYFYDLLNWNSNTTDYDKGQKNLACILSEKNYELLSYSSHAPQIINKKLFTEMVSEFFEIGLEKSIDEWSTYFNYSISKYPYLFNKKIFKTLNWPALPTDWKYQYTPDEYLFENYYRTVYADNPNNSNGLRYFLPNFTAENKIKIKNEQYSPHKVTYELFDKYNKFLAKKNKIYGSINFKGEGVNCFLFSVPKEIITVTSAQFRLTMNCKVWNESNKPQQIEIYYLISGNEGHNVKLNIPRDRFFETIVELPISTYGLQKKAYKLQIDIKIDGVPLYENKSPFKIKLRNYLNLSQVRLPDNFLEVNGNIFIGSIEIQRIKHYIVTIPYVGNIIAKSYKVLRNIINSYM